jgi:hypothetical protein
MNAPTTVFCLASGRSGTRFLFELLRRNTTGLVCQHEPYLWNPSMFGRAIYDRTVGDTAGLRALAERKRQVIERHLRTSAGYAETSHAFLKSWAEPAVEFFPRMKLVHLVRNVLAVAKSETLRAELIHRLRLFGRNYRGGDGKRYFRWSLTGLEPIFAHVAGRTLTAFQWHVVQWIEIENRAMRFLAEHGKEGDCFRIHSPVELNDPAKLRALLDFLEVPRRGSDVRIEGSTNRTLRGRTEPTDVDRAELAEVISLLPASTLAIFDRPPYRNWAWSAALSPPRGLPR